MLPPVLLDHADRRREVGRLGQIEAADRIASREVLEPQRMTGEALRDVRSVQPRLRAVLLDTTVFTEKLRFFAQALFCDADLAQDVVDRDRLAELRNALPDLVDVAPAVRIVDHVDHRKQTLLVRVPEEKPRRAFHQLIIDAVVLISGSSHGQQQRVSGSCTHARLHDFIHFQPPIAGPRRHLVAEAQRWIEAIRRLRLECDALHDRIDSGDLYLRLAAAPDLRKHRLIIRFSVVFVALVAAFFFRLVFRIELDHLPGRIVDDVRLFQLRSHAVDLRAVAAIS